MNKEEILNKYIDLIDKGYCSDCNELNCIDNFPHSKIARAIRELQQENKKYKEVIDKAIMYIHLNKQKTISAYGDNEDDDFEIELWEEDIDKLLDILKEVSE